MTVSRGRFPQEADFSQMEIQHEPFMAEITAAVEDYLDSGKREARYKPSIFKDIPYAIQLSTRRNEIAVEFFHEKYNIVMPAYLTYSPAEGGKEISVGGYYRNESKGRFVKIATVLMYFDEALSTALSKRKQKNVERVILTDKQPIRDLMEKHGFTYEKKSGELDRYTKRYPAPRT